MKTILLGMAATSMLATGVPAAAQYSNGGVGNNRYGGAAGANGNIAARIDQLRVRIQTGVQSGAISRAEAPQLRQQLRDLTRLERQYSANGLTGPERADLQQRLRTLRQQLRTAEGGQGGYGDDRYEDDRYGRTDGYVDRDRDGRDDRYEDDDRYGNAGGYEDRDRDGRDDRYEDDGGYQEPARRGGLGGLIDGVLGRNGASGVRVGQRAPGNLGGVPYEYRNQYRDGNGVYFRSDGRQIYEIDARTQTVVRVYGLNR